MLRNSATRLSLSNFRGFRKANNIQLAPLTILVGPNSAGKSSIFDAILFITQSNLLPTIRTQGQLKWIGNLVDLGSFQDTVFAHKNTLSIKIGIDINLIPHSFIRSRRESETSEYITRFEFIIKGAAKDPIGRLSRLSITDISSGALLKINFLPTKIPKVEVFFENYSTILNVDESIDDRNYFFSMYQRIITVANKKIDKRKLKPRGRKAGWNRIFDTLASFSTMQFSAGVERVSSGRSAPERWYTQSKDFSSAENLYESVNPGIFDFEELSEQGVRGLITLGQKQRSTKNIMNETLKALNIAKKISSSRLSAYHTSIQLTDSETSLETNLKDVGYGASQVIPVIAACQSQSIGPLFVEQPEIHLHPKAQGKIAELLCETSKYRQVFIETHSVHMINRARILVAENKLPKEHVTINYIEKTEKGSIVHNIPLDENGNFTRDWPKGFFDERYEDTLRLMKLKK